jgi:hypothetical protein
MNKFRFSPLYAYRLKHGNLAGIVDETLVFVTPDIAALLGDVGVKTIAKLRTDVATMKSAMNRSHSSLISTQISAANEAYDDIFRDIKRNIKAAIKSTVPAKVEVGNRLLRIFDNFWDTEKSMLLTQVSMTNELLLRYGNDAALIAAAQTIGIADLFDALATQNATLSTLLRERTGKHVTAMPTAKILKVAVIKGYDTLRTLVVKNLNMDNHSEVLIPVFRAMDDIRKKHSAHIRSKPDLKNAVTEIIALQTYTGKAITPIPVVSYGGTDLEFAKDFSITYKNNVKLGEATAILHGKGRFMGVHKRRFNIVV